MRDCKKLEIKVWHPGQDELVTEPVPGDRSRSRNTYMLVSVGYGRDRYNFAIPLPKSGAPEHILLGDRLLTKMPFDVDRVEGHPNYSETKIRPLVVCSTTPVTFPDRIGPARPILDWDHHPETRTHPC